METKVNKEKMKKKLNSPDFLKDTFETQRKKEKGVSINYIEAKNSYILKKNYVFLQKTM